MATHPISDKAQTSGWDFITKTVDKRALLQSPPPDPREELAELEDQGEVKVIHITDENRPIEVETLLGRTKRIPTTKLWHHKSCGQCGNIPGYPTSIMWFMNKLGLEYLDETHQTSCTAWNYHGSGTSNLVALASVAVRNWHRAYETGYFPLIHCGTSFGNYKEMRNLLIEHKDLREEVRRIMRKVGRDLVIPEEIVHYSEWLHVLRDRVAALKVHDVSSIIATVHPACHVWKLVPDDVIYDPAIYGGQRPAPTTAILLALGVQVADYSTWYDCCGFGFRHILTEREFSRSFSLERKIKVMVEEAHSDVAVTQDTGCTTTLDKNQWIGKAHGYHYDLPVMADVQFAALAAGADPYKVVQIQWHTSGWEKLLDKMGVDWRTAKSHYEAYLEDLKGGREPEQLYVPPDESAHFH